ncbi:EARLY NODULIN-LIKE PROTEIN 21 [Salix koriyanagi]|uniref:EARLY NODULIN-LIKE PROTEIN 21 n=1 Tax=Salix koriyanagi TaxID=2511006 RepID=A0A9Q0X0Q0_9ROSI|nr:EARLY NODULIN-LIKE PROTEIN 21 [Salix koriyanagi]
MISSTMQMSLFLMTILSSLQFLSVSSFEYQIGGNEGWVVPPANDTGIYNDWASENRFQVGDTVRFRYRKDSVMEVSVEDYKKCNSSHPNFFSNTGNDVVHLNRSGSFYFMSGVSGHCEKGQRMIVKVVSSDQENDSGGEKSAAASPSALVLSFGVFKAVLTQLVSFKSVWSEFFDKEKEIVESVEQTSDIECKGEKECESYYMLTGSCGYGVTCRFHHPVPVPVPVAAEVSKPFNSTCSGAFMRGHSLGNHNLESFTSQSKRSTCHTQHQYLQIRSLSKLFPA